MARGNSRACILALMAILSIVAGNLSPVMGKRDFLNSLPKTNEFTEDTRETSTEAAMRSQADEDSASTQSSGTWGVFSNMDGIINLQCQDASTDLGTTTLYPQTSLTHTFPIQVGVTDPHDSWYCFFTWDSLSGPMEQNFVVWSFFTCDDCEWKVQNDGFYFKQKDGSFVLQWKWTPWAGPGSTQA